MLEELSPETRALLNEARRAELEPPLGAKTRIWQGLEPQLASVAAGGVLAPSLSAFAKTAIAATAAVAVGVVGVRLVTREPAESAPVVVPPAVVAAELAPAPVTEPAPVASSVPTTPRPVRAIVPSRLSEETALLAQVNVALRGGQPSRALTLLGEYDRRFSGGELRPERSAARVFALCGLGRSALARAEAARFLKTWPRSPLTARVSGSCASVDPLKASP